MNYSEYSFVFSINGTICPVKKREEKYESLIPYTPVVEKIRFYHEADAKIVLFTSHNTNSYGRSLDLINKSVARIPIEWLDKWNIPYNEIFYDKPWSGHKGFYVDDRSVRPDESLTYTPEELTKRYGASRAKED